MNRSLKRLIVTSLALTLTALAEKDTGFKARPAASYASKQTVEKVTIAVSAFSTEERMREAFGKVDLNKSGVLPVLVVIRNETGKTLLLDRLRVAYVSPKGQQIDATPASELPYLTGPSRPKYDASGPIPGGGPRIKRKKNPMSSELMEVRGFSAKLIPNGEEGSGFFYFHTGIQSGAQIYVTGMREAGSGKEIFYAEIPLAE
ncbi:MAG: hypothetical protein ACKV22_12090 [Bryobacteraceae bacterium]